MGCGTWQKNTIDNNLNYKHFLNITRISNLIPGKEASLKDYFQEYCKNNDPDNLKNFWPYIQIKQETISRLRKDNQRQLHSPQPLISLCHY